MNHYSIALPAGIIPHANVRLTTDNARGDADVICMRRFMAGDDLAFEQLFNAHNNRLFNYCANIVRDDQAAEDITQEMWLKILRIRSEPKEIGNPVGLFLTIVRNLSLNYLERRRRQSRLDGTEELIAAPGRERTMEEEMVVLALEQLSFDYREVLLLNVYSGYTLEEIATMLGKSNEAIWKRATRARAKLSKLVIKMLETERRRMNNAGYAAQSNAGAYHD
jgi:RNA polymerase sigma-70 factor (ECF subfamily)